ncbi:MAG: ABC transporter permease, partial [Tannerellaceae bacterium]|nr:ABC transporter permease [Tannerellaceae bacterium]
MYPWTQSNPPEAIAAMYKYFKQAWNLIRQERLFSAIYIVGTGLSITAVMALSIVLYIKLANIYPETNRHRILVVNGAGELMKEDKGMWASCLSVKAIEACFYPLESAEAVTAFMIAHLSTDDAVQLEGKARAELPVMTKYIDPQFWTVYPFRFIEGKPFGEAEFKSGLPVAVVSRSLARKLFGTDKGATGRYFSLNFKQYQVSGVVRDASFATNRSYGDLFVPYTVVPNYGEGGGLEGSLGAFQAVILAPSAADLPKVKAEALERIERYSSTLRDVTFSVFDQPDSHWESIFRMGGNHRPDYTAIIRQYLLIFLALLLVPAV